jgi:DNA invertase Pin-like site-specific DNA recombinase
MTKNPRAALYLRSSKDRSDISIDTQRRDLQKLAADRGIIIAAEYSDVVESGKDAHRPGFQHLITDLRSPARAWSAVLLLDTSRLARRRHLALLFEHDAEKRGVQVIYKSIPESDPITGMLLKSILQAMDEWHSLTSRQKGLGGMAENVHQGYRAGGRAPRGYRLKHTATGAIRDGGAVTKSTLIKSDDARTVARYLKGRAAGRSRKALCAELHLTWPASTLISMEWNALTYAGHTVWNVHAEFRRGEGYKGGAKRRPRAEWVIQKNTHTALITEAEAEQLLARLDTGRQRTTYRTSAAYLLTGLMVTPEGKAWHSSGDGYYRVGKSRRVSRETIEQAVIHQVADDMKSDKFVAELARAARKAAQQYSTDPCEDLRRRVGELNGQISVTMDLAAKLADPGPAVRKIDELEAERLRLGGEIKRSEVDYQAAVAMASITEGKVKMLLNWLLQEMDTGNRESLKDFLATILETVTLDPVTMEARLHYRIGLASGDLMASPRGSDEIPALRLVTALRVA